MSQFQAAVLADRRVYAASGDMLGAGKGGCIRASGAMQASGMLSLSALVTSLGMLWPSGLSLLTLVAAVCCDGTGHSSRSHHSLLIAMVVGVSPATMLGENTTMWPSSAVMLA